MKTLLAIKELCCPHETQMVERALAFITPLRLIPDYEARQIWVIHDDGINPQAIVEAIANTGLTVHDITPGDWMQVSISTSLSPQAIAEIAPHAEVVEFNTQAHFVTFKLKRHDVPELFEKIKTVDDSARLMPRQSKTHDAGFSMMKFGLALLLAILAEVIDLYIEHGAPTHVNLWQAAMMTLSLSAIILVGFQTVFKGLKQMLKAQFTMNGLMAIAVVGGLCIGVFPEAAMVMVLFEVSEAIEAMVVKHAQKSIHHLLDTTPPMADVLDRDGHSTATPVEYVPVGTLVRVAVGSRVPLDGLVVQGQATLDESMLTGESAPVSKTQGDTLWGGTNVVAGTLVMKTTATHEKSLAQRLTEAVKAAQTNRSPLERFIDQFARYYTPSVLAIAILVAAVGSLVTGEIDTWVYRALVMLVIACPCALVISTPVTILSALALGSRHGLLIKGGQFLEIARKIQFVGLDKTGTLTRGMPDVNDVFLIDEHELTLRLAASLAGLNHHPLSDAITQWAKREGLKPLALTQFESMTGVGVKARYRGSVIELSRVEPWQAFLEDMPQAQAFITQHQTQGHSLVVFGDCLGPRAIFALHDPVKAQAAPTLERLRQLGMTPVLLTGDHALAAKSVAEPLGLDYQAGLTPEAKLLAIDHLKQRGLTAMVGDGMNDAPALASSHLGVVMGVKGSSTAMEAAHVALMDDRIEGLVTLRELSVATHRVLKQNIALAIVIKVVFMVLAMMGLATMWMAVFADTGTSLMVVANGMRMLKMKLSQDQGVLG